MRKILEWIKKHKLRTFGLCVLAFSLPLLAVHALFKIEATNDWFMVNTRREFFRVSLDEIKAVVKQNFDQTVDFVDVPLAEQYRQSELMRK